MHEKLFDALMGLEESICKELSEMNEKIQKAGNKLSSGDVEALDKLTHTLKSLKSSRAMMEAEGGQSYRDGNGGSYNGYSRGGGSYNGYSRYDMGGGSYGYPSQSMGPMGGWPDRMRQ